MPSKPSAFKKQVLAHRPPEALYYFLVGTPRHGRSTRAPVRGTFRLEPFEHPAANPGLYRVRYCRDRSGQDQVATKEYMPLARLLSQDTAQEEATRVFAAFKNTVQQKAPPEAAAYSLVSCDGVAQRLPDAGRPLTLRDPFQFPQQVLAGPWEVRYHSASAPDAPSLETKERVRIEIVEPVGYGDMETLFWSMDGRFAWYAKQRAAEEAQLELLTSAIAEMKSLRVALTEVRKQLAPSPVDYSPILTQIVTTFRELWQASSAPPASPAAAAPSVAHPQPPRKRRRRRRKGRGQPATTPGASEQGIAQELGFRSLDELAAALALAEDPKLPFDQATTAARR